MNPVPGRPAKVLAVGFQAGATGNVRGVEATLRQGKMTLATSIGNGPDAVSLEIFKNGTQLSDADRFVVVGELMTLEVRHTPADAVVQNIRWDVSGAPVTAYQPTVAHATVTPLQAGAVPHITFAWPFADSYTVAVFAQVNGQALRAAARFTVVAPQLVGPVATLNRPRFGPDMDASLPGDWLALYDPDQSSPAGRAGFLVITDVRAPEYHVTGQTHSTAGEVAFIQLTSAVQRRRVVTDGGPVDQTSAASRTTGDPWDTGNFRLDVPPLAAEPTDPPPTPLPANGQVNVVKMASPGVWVDPRSTSVSVDQEFRTYLCYRASGNAIWAPLGRYEWSWTATIARATPDAAWGEVSGTASTPANAPVSVNKLPEWTRNVNQDLAADGGPVWR